MQILLTVVIGTSLLFADVNAASPKFWVVIVAIITASLGVNILLVNQLLMPLKDLAAALTHASGEPTDIIPPNPNAKHYEQDGFKPLLQYIYENQPAEPEKKRGDGAQAAADIERAFNQTSAGIVVLNSSGKILFDINY